MSKVIVDREISAVEIFSIGAWSDENYMRENLKYVYIHATLWNCQATKYLTQKFLLRKFPNLRYLHVHVQKLQQTNSDRHTCTHVDKERDLQTQVVISFPTCS